MARGKRPTDGNDDYSDHFEEAARHLAQGEGDDVPLLPWLEAVDEDDLAPGSSRAALWVGGGVAFALIAALGIYMLQPRSSGPDLAAAPATDSMPAPIDAVPPLPEALPAPPPPSRPVRAHARPGPAPAPIRATPAQSRRELRSGPTIQLASYYSSSRAAAYWDVAVRRHKALARLDHAVVTGTVNGRTVYRLRASGAGAFEACNRLRSARVGCLQIGH
jgi:hypothetical protein